MASITVLGRRRRGQVLQTGSFSTAHQVGLGSVDPNLNDSDWNFSRLGFRSVKLAASDGFLSLADATFTGYFSENLGDEKNLNLTVGNYNASQVYQFDFTVKL